MGEEADYLDDGADYIEPDVTCENCIFSRYKRNKKQNILICQVTGEIAENPCDGYEPD
jgi:hypothetical protein